MIRRRDGTFYFCLELPSLEEKKNTRKWLFTQQPTSFASLVVE